MKKAIIAIVVIVAVVVVALVVRSHYSQESEYGTSPSSSEYQTSSPLASESASPSPSASHTSHKTVMIHYTASGINPKSVTINTGDTVTFVNNDSQPHWPASDPHPTHTICPGFDALHGLATGETYSFTFTVAKTCPFHDHLNASNSSFHGQVIVK